jgi:hypothetical protein
LIDLDQIIDRHLGNHCSHCSREVDAEVCWCGEFVSAHDYYDPSHRPVPMGCACGYGPPDPVELAAEARILYDHNWDPT